MEPLGRNALPPTTSPPLHVQVTQLNYAAAQSQAELQDLQDLLQESRKALEAQREVAEALQRQLLEEAAKKSEVGAGRGRGEDSGDGWRWGRCVLKALAPLLGSLQAEQALAVAMEQQQQLQSARKEEMEQAMALEQALAMEQAMTIYTEEEQPQDSARQRDGIDRLVKVSTRSETYTSETHTWFTQEPLTLCSLICCRPTGRRLRSCSSRMSFPSRRGWRSCRSVTSVR
jgi:hypothetical protein